VVTINSVTSLTFPAVSGGRWAVHGIGQRVVAHAVTACVASGWMVAAVMALQGLCLLAIPDQWRHRVATTIQAAVFLVLLASVPYFIRLTGRVVSSETVTLAPQKYLPPIWFLGVERWLLDGSASGGYAGAAWNGLIAWVVSLAVIGSAFVVLFRS